MNYDWLVVGAGFTGAVLAERIASQLRQTVLVIDRRDHIAGNAYDYYDEAGILVHRYGPHVFHTKNARVWKYLSKFTEWQIYQHRVLVEIDGVLVPVPFNFTAIDTLFAGATAARLKQRLIAEYGENTRIPILHLRRTTDAELGQLAAFVYEKVFYGYTLKQWGLPPDDIAPSVTGRVPIRVGYDDRYFDDPYQAIPRNGYTELLARILDHPRIGLRLQTDFNAIRDDVDCDNLVFTGPIDEYFDYRIGALPYRSLRFERHTLEQTQFQPVGQVNYPNDVPFTRITEFKHLTGQLSPYTSIAYEYPQPYEPGHNEPYYPIPRHENRAMYAQYNLLAKTLRCSVVFAGRLADYKYYNMDQAVARALTLARRLFSSGLNCD